MAPYIDLEYIYIYTNDDKNKIILIHMVKIKIFFGMLKIKIFLQMSKIKIFLYTAINIILLEFNVMSLTRPM